MRPFVLDPIFTSVRALKGVGPRTAKLVEKLVGSEKLASLLWHLPVRYIDRRFAPKIANAPNGRIVTLTVKIDKHIPAPSRARPYRIRCSDETGTVDLVYFHAKKPWLEAQFPIGATRIISGEAEYFHGTLQMPHPEMVGTEAERDKIEIVEPVYPMTAGLTHRMMHKIISQTLPQVPVLPEWLDAAFLAQEKWPGWREAVLKAHHPESEEDLSPRKPERERLAYDELLANQLAITLVRNHNRQIGGRAMGPPGKMADTLRKALPFQLTSAQERAIKEINADMHEPMRMLRLLQGDVGSGKTVVAFFAMLNAVASGAQAALMAPTEILAQQHSKTISDYAATLGLETVILTGRHKGKARQEILEKIADGSAKIIIGTHALFQDDVIFHDLGLAVVDEQHRFGVHQRLKLAGKGKDCDILVMTATPIPRTLTLTAYGDMDFSRLDEKPAGRKPIDTRLVSTARLEEVVAGLKRKIETDARAYWICPLVEESEVMDLAAAEERWLTLQQVFGDRTGLLHGRMNAAEKDAVMQRFVAGEIDVLVSTTVIEVGVDVPEATVMVIEHAERFGLSQLHQLRGRVGRSDEESACILVYDPKIGETGKKRLTTIRNTEDGFLIAEEDLKLRGAGELLGTRQSGMPEFKLANLHDHARLVKIARDDARLIIAQDPDLQTPRGQALRTLLYLFERDNAIQYLRSG
ncbi:MAG: ATP-dependent DNA helicase RecG [Pseudomonadota bacterium]|nr:ATP-dependent DNA helicase RecG [Pseudomonadota bacterium]QKK05194.1 MAG: ATP-dependent DNA helicase RecG [Pseudomonadota bacterium]